MTETSMKLAGIICRGLLMLALVTACACSQNDTRQAPGDPEGGQTAATEDSPPSDAGLPGAPVQTATDDPPSANGDGLFPEVWIKTSLGDITLKLDAEKAPVTVENFLDNYVARGFYDGTIIHYVEPGAMVMGGGYTVDAELKETRAPITNEADNGLKNLRGTIAMARDPERPHSATSQFFFNLADDSSFDHIGRETSEEFGYCVFGEVVSGIEVLDKIGQLEVHDNPSLPSCPKDPPVIQSVERLQ